MSTPDTTILIDKLSAILTHQGRRMATAESCTGGMIAAACTDRAGSSDWFNGGIISYANELKVALLGVPQEAIATHGAVSENVVRHMALGALRACGAQAAVSVSGVAGPSGGSKDKPVGTVCVAWALADAKGGNATVSAHTFHFEGDRAAVRRATVVAALQGMIERLEESA